MSFFPNSTSPKTSLALHKRTHGKAYERVAEKPETGVRKEEMSQPLRSYYSWWKRGKESRRRRNPRLAGELSSDLDLKGEKRQARVLGGSGSEG